MACAAANATLDIFENENVIANNLIKIQYMQEKLKRFESLANVATIRQQGMVCAIKLKGYAARDRIGLRVYEYGLSKGVLLRPLGDVIYFMPPYVIKIEEIEVMMEVAYEAIASLLHGM